MRLMQFLRDWSLPIAMLGGASAYLLYRALPLPDGTGNLASTVVSYLQPSLIFSMLFVTFCKVRINDLKPLRWHLWLLLFQVLLFIVFSLSIGFFRGMPSSVKVLLEAAMMCFITPTATAAAVRKASKTREQAET